MALDVDGTRVVDDLSEIDWTREWDGHVQVRQVVPPWVVDVSHGWAVVIVCVQDLRRFRAWDPPRYLLTRWRKMRGAWRLEQHMRVPRRVLDALLAGGSDYLDTVQRQETRACG